MAGRQVKLVWGSSSLSLNDSTYRLQADGGWISQGNGLALRVLVECSSMAEMDRTITAVRQVIARAVIYQTHMIGDVVEVWMKTCDDLTTIAEIGATWMRKRVRSGRVDVQHLGGVAAAPNAILTIVLEVDEYWQRCQPASVLEATTGAASITSLAGGGITLGNAAIDLYARRQTWSSSTGLTGRVFWTFASGSNQLAFLRISGTMRCYYGFAAERFYIYEEAGNYAESAVVKLVAGQTYEVTFAWSATNMKIWLDGVEIATRTGAPTWPTDPATYRVIASDASSGTQNILSVQVWPTALTGAQAIALAAWGRPEAELLWCEPPADTKATNAVYKLHNAPGAVPAPLRLLLDGDAQDFARVALALRMYGHPTALRFECESGSLGANTAANVNAAASGGSQARFTPAATGWTTEVTVTVAATPSALAAMQGEYRLYLAGYDSAAAVQINQVRWRLVVAGVAGDWSEAYAFGAVSTRSMMQMDTVMLAPGNWPQETVVATSTEYGGAFATIEIQTMNKTGSGGGTLDLDALILAPAEMEGSITATLDVSAVHLLLDWCSDPPAFILVSSLTSLEFGGWGSYAGDDFLLPPSAGRAAGSLAIWWYRSSTEEFYPNDLCDVLIFYSPRWL
jgi:hypothetical protein